MSFHIFTYVESLHDYKIAVHEDDPKCITINAIYFKIKRNRRDQKGTEKIGCELKT